ncbi:MAG: TlpA disulfide reductase family protein, partial [Myxococcota bacterium]
MKRAFLVFVILAGLAVAGAAIAAVAQVGVPAPDFSLRDLNGRKVSLSDYAYQGPEKKGRPKKVVLLDFFRTDCGPCKKELPLVEQVYRKYRDKGFEVMLV